MDRQSRSALVEELERAGSRAWKGNACRCPFHDDASPSAGVYRDGDVWRFKCHGCGVSGDVYDIRARVEGRPLAEVLREANPVLKDTQPFVYPSLEALEVTLSNVAARYVYTNPDTRRPDLVVFRLESDKKSFIQATPKGEGFVKRGCEGRWPLYNRTRLRDAAEVIVAEGEKCVHVLHELGFVATTSPGGAGKAERADWSPLAGKIVYLWPDNDEKGVAHMRDVQRRLETLNCRTHWLEPGDLELPPKGDCVEFIAQNGGANENGAIAVRLALEGAQAVGVAEELGGRLEEIIAGKWRNVEWPWPQLTHGARALLPGTITLVPGDPGAGKSFLVLEAAWFWHMIGCRVAVFELEEDRTYHLQRALAQMADCADLTDDEWIKLHPQDARTAFTDNKDLLETFGRRVWEAPDREVTLPELTAWVEERCAEGCDVLVIDPITAAKTGESRWLEDNKFIYDTKTILRKYGARLVLVTHPKESAGKGKPGTLAGGKAYERFSQSVLWLKRHDKLKKEQVERPVGRSQVTFDREVQIRKARNGKAAGKNIAFVFNPITLRFEEQGLVVEGETKAVMQIEEERSW